MQAAAAARALELMRETRAVVGFYVRVAPNSHLGEETPREDLRLCFSVIRSYVREGRSIREALAHLDRSACAMEDM